MEVIGKLRQLGLAPRDQYQVVVVFGEQLRQFVSDAARGAGNKSGLRVLVGCHFEPS